MDEQIGALTDLVAAGDVVVLTGAGMSTDSGIPDYRGPSGTLRQRLPMTYREFVSDPVARQRYWARSHLGWRHVADADPNPAHRAVATLERGGWLRATITQNVDGLHQKAGSRDVIDLHGRLATVVCLGCGTRSSRDDLSLRLREANPDVDVETTTVAPDGDAELAAEVVERFTVVDCRRCRDGVLKPDVVFFGENVPRDRVARCFAHLDGARCLLVLGSSLTVMSGYRFVIHARKHDIPVAIVNRGTTRGDDDATVKIDATLAEALPRLLDGLRSTDATAPTPGRDAGTVRSG
ncbi:MAG: NAD-dependent protein deacetylase [Actinomycetota bacterium]|nr:NAD-dependent protein deacetylase [Actinomycetota bacterium]